MGSAQMLLGPFHGAIAVPCHALSLSSLSVVIVNFDAQVAYKNYYIDHNQILQSDRDPQILTVVVQICLKQILGGGRPPS